MQEKNHILKILKKTQESLQKKDYIRIKSLSDKIIHQASTEQDPDIISLAIIIYSLSKLIERESYKTEKNWNKFYSDYIKNIKDMIQALEKNNLEKFRYEIESNRILIEKLSGKLKQFIEDVFRKARVNKASKIYEHGISMEKTAKILGITIWELTEYAGQTKTGDINLAVTIPIEKRIKIAEEIFK